MLADDLAVLRPDAPRPLAFPMDLDVRSPEFWAEDRDGWPFWAVSVDVECLDFDAFDDDGNLIGDDDRPSDLLPEFLGGIDVIGRVLEGPDFQDATGRREVAS